jgi:DNA polymerase III delta prime subunit
MNRRPILSTYTPSNTDPELLKRIFVQREKLLERIVDRLSRSMTTGDKHHILLIGPRGCGKTNLVSLAVWELQKKSQLADCMRIAWLGEDDSFTGLIHLAFGIANQLAKEYPKEFPADFKTAVRGLPNDDAALAVLRSTVGRLGARNLLLVTENMDQTFHSLGDSGQKKWRAFLQETRKIATLATAQQLFSGVSDRNEAFFGFFDIRHLEPLSVDEAVELNTRISLEHSNRELIRYLKSAEGQFRIRALHYLAGGNHRMYVLLSEFLTKESLDDLVAAFDSLANDMTPFFQERIRALPDQQRQLVQCLCDAQGALTVKEIASETFIDERVCSKQLGNLKDKGYVRSERRGKESYYDMAEPLMRLCLEVKNQHGRPLRLLARFLRAWFPVTELESKLNGNNNARVSEYCKLAIESGDGFKGTLALIDHCSLEEVKAALARAFDEGSRETSEYGGAPHDLLGMVLGRSPSQWPNYISMIASMYIEYGCADKLGQGITKSIQHLDQGGFSKSQIESWNAAWQQAVQGSDALEIPLRCLDVAVEVMNSDPRSDRALFRLPLELRGLIRPLLNRSLGDLPVRKRHREHEWLEMPQLTRQSLG